ncbi:hypothetical protein Tco_0477332 [Tanacetum coccineum]
MKTSRIANMANIVSDVLSGLLEGIRVCGDETRGRANFHRIFRCHRLYGIETISGDAGVKNDILTPEGERKRRIHQIGEIGKKNSDNICEGKIMAILIG